MVYFLKIFCLLWVVFKLQYEVRTMKYEFSFTWLKDNFTRVLNCWYCFTFWLTLSITRDIFLASMLSFTAHVVEILINKNQITKL